MPSKDDLIEELNWISDRVSERVWTISIGVLVFCLTFVVESIGAQDAFLEPRQVVAPIVLALSAVVFDLLQYLTAYKLSRDHYARMKAEQKSSMPFDYGSWVFKARVVCFRFKILFCMLAAIWLIVVVSKRTFGLVT